MATATGKTSTAVVTVAAPIRVRATAAGFYGGQRIRPGVVFTIASAGELGRWMQPVDVSIEDQIAARFAPRKKRPGEQPEGHVIAFAATREAVVAGEGESVI